MSTGGPKFARFAQTVSLLAVCAASVCRAQPQLCKDPAPLTDISIRKVSWDLSLDPDIKLIPRPVSLPDVAIQARVGDSGELACYSPISGWSIYWNAAAEVVKREISKERMPSSSSRVFVFADPGRGSAQQAWISARGARNCVPSDERDAALAKGQALFMANRNQDAEECYAMVLQRAPNSMAANYGAARAAGAQGKQGARVAAYERAVVLAPQFYEAKVELAYAYDATGKPDAAESLLMQMTKSAPPPAAKRSFEALTWLADKQVRRADATQLKKTYVELERRLRSVYPPSASEAVFAFDTKDLAVREEEIGDYMGAFEDFTNAVRLARVDSVSEAVRFQADLGRIRNARRLGRPEEAASGCEEWRKRLSKLGREVDDSHWGGKAVTTAQWEASCGDFSKAIAALNAEARRDLGADFPYRAMESLYRSVGKSALADRAKMLAERVRTEHDKAILKSILSEAERLAKDGNAVVVEK